MHALELPPFNLEQALEFADARGSRITTVRTQLSALLAKTGTQRQQDLVALVARLMLLAPGQAREGAALPASFSSSSSSSFL